MTGLAAQAHKAGRDLFSPARFGVPPGPPVALGAALGIWLFAQQELTMSLMALLVAALVAIGYVRARSEAGEARAALRAQAAQNAELEFALRASGLATWRADLQARRVAADAGAVKLLGLKPVLEDALRPTPSFIHAEDGPAFARAHAQCLETGVGGPIDARIVNREGEAAWVRIHMRATRGRDGALQSLFFVASNAQQAFQAFDEAHARLADVLSAAEARQSEFTAAADRLRTAL